MDLTHPHVSLLTTHVAAFDPCRVPQSDGVAVGCGPGSLSSTSDQAWAIRGRHSVTSRALAARQQLVEACSRWSEWQSHAPGMTPGRPWQRHPAHRPCVSLRPRAGFRLPSWLHAAVLSIWGLQHQTSVGRGRDASWQRHKRIRQPCEILPVNWRAHGNSGLGTDIFATRGTTGEPDTLCHMDLHRSCQL
jgi:hypothetical protein